MKKTIFYLNTCSTNQRILKELGVDDTWEKREIKTEPMTEQEVDKMAEMAGSYEAIFSRKSMKYRAWNLKEKTLTETDYRQYILEEYTFLKRPVVILDNDIYVGNAKAAVGGAKEKLEIAK